jgi:hypothetical protein
MTNKTNKFLFVYKDRINNICLLYYISILRCFGNSTFFKELCTSAWFHFLELRKIIISSSISSISSISIISSISSSGILKFLMIKHLRWGFIRPGSLHHTLHIWTLF